MRTVAGLLMLVVVLPLFSTGCRSGIAAMPELDYGDAENWIIADSGIADRSYDLFYIYPTLVNDQTKPYMDWSDPEVVRKATGFTAAQTLIFSEEARIFAPRVRQLEYSRCLGVIEGGDWGRTMLARGIADTIAAFDYYRDNFNEGRPYVLFGHSQGAVDLYELLKADPEITCENGFVAAYLIGLPKVQAEEIVREFAGRNITPATGAEDTGVIVVWNTQNHECSESMFTGDQTCCINPLNWETDATPADRYENLGALFYDYKTGATTREKAFCGAIIDPESGALIVDLPSNSRYDANGFMGPGVFHMNDVWFFAENLRRNAADRVEAWRREYEALPEAAE